MKLEIIIRAKQKVNRHSADKIVINASFYVLSGLHFQFRISGMSWPC